MNSKVSAGMQINARTTSYRVDPEPSADTTPRRARGQVGNLESGVQVPDTSVIYAEHGEIFGLDIVHIGLVSNGKSTTLDVVEAGGMEL